jgi:excisionase family DNA binding protein
MQAFDEIERFFSIAETCPILGCERSTVYSRIKKGRLKAVRIDGSKRTPLRIAEGHQRSPAGGGVMMNAQAEIAFVLGRNGPLTPSVLFANLGEHHSADAVTEAR